MQRLPHVPRQTEDGGDWPELTCIHVRETKKGPEQSGLFLWYNKGMSYYSDNREARLAYQKAYYERNKEARRAYQREYERKHPRTPEEEKERATWRKPFKQSDTQARYDEVGGKCEYCGRELHGIFHADHYIPAAKGGANDPENLRISCHSCNYKKGNRMPARA